MKASEVLNLLIKGEISVLDAALLKSLPMVVVTVSGIPGKEDETSIIPDHLEKYFEKITVKGDPPPEN